jgi:hypothetical protein
LGIMVKCFTHWKKFLLGVALLDIAGGVGLY